MGNFNRNNKFNRGADRGFSRGGFAGDRDSGRRVEMHKAVCSKCGNDCEVPFRPTSGKPVYCSNCFDRNVERNNGGSDSHSSREWSSRSEDRQMFDAVCDNCGKDCKVPFQPRGDKPIYCSNCFETRSSGGENPRTNSQPAQNTAQFDQLNAKLDRILTFLSKEEQMVAAVTEEVIAKPAKKAKAAKAPKETIVNPTLQVV